MHVVQDLDGVTIARGQADGEGVALTLFSPSGFTEGGSYFPAESITVNSVEGVRTLHNLLGNLLEEHDALVALESRI